MNDLRAMSDDDLAANAAELWKQMRDAEDAANLIRAEWVRYYREQRIRAELKERGA